MGSFARLWALVAACALTPALGSCAINPQPEPPGEADYSGGGGASGGPDAAAPLDAGPSGMGGAGGSGGAYTGGSGGNDDSGAGTADAGGTSNGVAPGAFDESYKQDDDLGARLDAVNAMDAGDEDAADSGPAGDGATHD